MSHTPWERLNEQGFVNAIGELVDIVQAKLDRVRVVSRLPLTPDTIRAKADFKVEIAEQEHVYRNIQRQVVAWKYHEDKKCVEQFDRFKAILGQLKTEVVRMEDQMPSSGCRCNIL